MLSQSKDFDAEYLVVFECACWACTRLMQSFSIKENVRWSFFVPVHIKLGLPPWMRSSLSGRTKGHRCCTSRQYWPQGILLLQCIWEVWKYWEHIHGLYTIYERERARGGNAWGRAEREREYIDEWGRVALHDTHSHTQWCIICDLYSYRFTRCWADTLLILMSTVERLGLWAGVIIWSGNVQLSPSSHKTTAALMGW